MNVPNPHFLTIGDDGGSGVMLTLQECLDYCDLTPDEIDAIAAHEHLSLAVAVEYGQYLIDSEDGVRQIKRIILDDIDDAERQGSTQRVLVLKGVLAKFIANHPDSDKDQG